MEKPQLIPPKIIYSLFIAVISILFIAGAFEVRQVHHQIIKKDWVIHSHEVLEQIDQVHINLLKLVQQQDAYFKTSDESHRKSFLNEILQTESTLQTLRNLTRDKPIQQQVVTRIDTTFNGIFPVIKDPKSQLINNENYVPQILAGLGEMSSEEYNLLNKRNTALNKSDMENYIGLSIIVILGILFLIVAFLIIFIVIKIAKSRDEVNKLSQELAGLKLDLVLQSSRLGAWDLDLKTMNAQRSLKHDQIFGYKELLPHWSVQSFMEHVIPEDRERIDKIINECFIQGTKLEFQCRIMRANDNTLRWIRLKGNKIRIASEEHFIGLIEDITQEKQNALALSLKEEQANLLINSIQDYAIIMLNSQGYITSWNVGAYNIYGYDTDEIIGQHFSRFFQKEAIENHHPEFELSDALAKGRHREEGPRLRRNGEIFPANSIITPIYDNGHQLTGFAKITRDLSEQKFLENKMKILLKELKRSNEELSDFAYVASHDLKAPLRAIESLITWIEQDKLNLLTPDSIENINLLRQRTQRMSNLIAGILQYSRAGQGDTEISTVNVKELLDEVVSSLSPPRTFHFHYSDDLPVIDTSRIRLSQIFSNLISNAIKYHHRQDGNIGVGFKDAGEFYEFYVADDGPGIEPEYHAKIFEIFQTLQSRDTIESTGIGLSIVKKIIEAQGGVITVKSGKGEGSTFQFSWKKR